MDASKVDLDKVLLFAKRQKDPEFIPLDVDYTYGGKSAVLAGKGTFTVKKEARAVTCHTCLVIPAKGTSFEVLVVACRDEKRDEGWEIDEKKIVGRFSVTTGNVQRYKFFGGEVSTCLVCGSHLCVQ